MNLTFDRLLLDRPKAEETTQGGILLPETVKHETVTGKVLDVGPGLRSEEGKRLPMEVKVGDTVLFGKFAGHEVEIDGVEYLIIRESDVFAKLEG